MKNFLSHEIRKALSRYTAEEIKKLFRSGHLPVEIYVYGINRSIEERLNSGKKN